MKILAWGAAIGAVAALVACGGGGGGNTGGTGTGGNASTSTTTVTSTSSGSTSSSSGTGGGGPACGITWEDPQDPARADCETCMEDNCCSEMENCADGTACGNWYTCVVNCKDDQACSDACTNANMQGLEDYRSLLTCYDDQCKTTAACVYPICDSMLVFPDQACAECLGTSCCDAAKACVNDATCAACIDPMPPAGCDTNTLFQTFDTCSNGSTCGPKCAGSICGSQLGYSGFASCNYCLSTQCCTSFDACIADMNSTCYKCLTTSGATGCDTDTNFQAFTMCRDVTCKDDC